MTQVIPCGCENRRQEKKSSSKQCVSDQIITAGNWDAQLSGVSERHIAGAPEMFSGILKADLMIMENDKTCRT